MDAQEPGSAARHPGSVTDESDCGLRVSPGPDQTSVFGEPPCQDEGTAVAEADHAAPRLDPLPSDPVIPPGDAAAQAEIGLPHDFDAPKLDRFGFPDTHGASPLGVRAEHAWERAEVPYRRRAAGL